MTTTNVLGIRNNNTIIPYTGTTKSTKQLSLVKTTDITAAVVAGTALDAGYTVTTSVRFHADSAGVWKMSIQGEIAAGGAGTNRTGIVITFVKASIKFMTTMQGPASAVPNTGTIVDAFAIKNTNTVEIDTSSGTASVWSFSGDFVLAQEPTDYTTVAANMEGVVAVDVFVPEATATVAGIVGTGAQTIAGNKTLNGFTSLGGDVALKCKRLSATFSNGTPYYGLAAHGLDGSKIIMVSFLVDKNSPNSDTASNIAYRGYFDATNVVWYGASTGSVTLYTKACEALVWYIA